MADFATRLRELRKKRDLRQVDLAQALGVAQTTIANYEKKLRFPDEQMLGRFADFFKVSLDFLLGRSDALHGPDDATVAVKREPSRATSGLAMQYLELLRSKLLEHALELLESAMRRGAGIKEIYLDVLEPALKETGRLWERGELRVGEEHAISEATQRIMSRIIQPLMTDRPAAGGQRCVVLAVSSERHTIGPRMVADFLLLDGWDVLFPGGNLSIGHVIEMLADRPPDLLAISVTRFDNVPEAEDLIAAIRDKPFLKKVKILAGGRVFQSRPTLWQEIGADGTAGNAESAVKAANSLVGRESPADKGERAAE